MKNIMASRKRSFEAPDPKYSKKAKFSKENSHPVHHPSIKNEPKDEEDFLGFGNSDGVSKARRESHWQTASKPDIKAEPVLNGETAMVLPRGGRT